MEDSELDENKDDDVSYNENYLVAFLDILGFKSVIDEHNNGTNTFKLDKIDLALKRAEFIISRSDEIAVNRNYDLGMIYKQFSDCMSISFKHPNMKYFEENKEVIDSRLFIAIESLRDIQLEMLKSKVYIRGGLALGQFHRENDKRIFSEGLINAHNLESKKAVYPRIVLHDNLLNIIKDMYEYHKKEMALLGVNKILVRDWEGTIFINPFNLLEVREKYLNQKEMKLKLEKVFGMPFPDYIKHKKEQDRIWQSVILKNVEDEIKTLQAKDKIDYKILKKYLWLKELIKWNQDKNSSNIKFNFIRYKDVK